MGFYTLHLHMFNGVRITDQHREGLPYRSSGSKGGELDDGHPKIVVDSAIGELYPQPFLILVVRNRADV